MNELLHTERTYVADLKCIIQVRWNQSLHFQKTTLTIATVQHTFTRASGFLGNGSLRFCDGHFMCCHHLVTELYGSHGR
jgi:hypothetical protein